MNDYIKERDKYWPVSKELLDTYRDGTHTHEDEDGGLVWWINGELHRDGDLPAVIHANGTLEWWKNGKRHRDGDRPAWIGPESTLEWRKNDLLHRDGDLPAVIWSNGTLEWRKNGRLIKRR